MIQTKFNSERFNQDYAIGAIAENAFREQCKIWDMNILKETPKSYFPDYDFLIQYSATKENESYQGDIILPVPETHEIKADFGKTGNIAVHFYSSSKKETDNYLPNCSLPCNAGLFKTKADFYTVFSPYDEMFYIAPTHLLREYLRKTPEIKKLLANKHKVEQTGIALIPKSVWLKEFYSLPYTPDEYAELAGD